MLTHNWLGVRKLHESATFFVFAGGFAILRNIILKPTCLPRSSSAFSTVPAGDIFSKIIIPMTKARRGDRNLHTKSWARKIWKCHEKGYFTEYRQPDSSRNLQMSCGAEKLYQEVWKCGRFCYFTEYTARRSVR